MKLNITAIGIPKTRNTRNGPKEVNYIKAKEYNNEFLNFWLGPTTKDWKIGDEIEVLAVEENKYMGKDGIEKTSHDIKLPKFGNAELEARVKDLEDKFKTVQKFIREAVVEGLKNHNERLRALEPKLVAMVGNTNLHYPLPENEVSDPDNMANFDQSLDEENLDNLDKTL